MLTNAPHPVLACAAAIDAALKDLDGVEPVFMCTAEKAASLVELARLEIQLAAWRMRVMATADDVAEDSGARDVAAWLAHHTQSSPKACRAELHLATALDTRWTRLASVLCAGGVNLAQARVIARALDELPDDLDPALLVQAEEHLVEAAKHHAPDQLRVLGRRILDVIAPEVGEAEEAKQLQREEERAWETTRLALTRRGDGTTRLSGVLPDAAAVRLATYLDAFTSPRRPLVEEVAQRPSRNQGQARGHAFIALLEHLDPAKLPDHGGDATTVMVTIDYAALTKDLAAAGLVGTDDKITAGEARRLACTAQIVPVVLGGKSEILDLGRTRRLFSRAQHKAMRLRDRRCRGEHCTIPATWCEAHHLKPWLKGGKTDLADGVLLCSHHHHRAHDPRYSTERMPNGDIRFHRRN
ncbi:HNH endonuclease signature motif containing protein [Nocardioides speluncae]|uniref:HNH endonuclease signature motif containing protein n=1 Tax=Nocardioides speluncae TaxID=2670337 RepID=UPI000D68906B|nr:HNH endonuclease signature motif containing protein [Nocardioides speluncae]